MTRLLPALALLLAACGADGPPLPPGQAVSASTAGR